MDLEWVLVYLVTSPYTTPGQRGPLKLHVGRNLELDLGGRILTLRRKVYLGGRL